jgi:hypothetical protein
MPKPTPSKKGFNIRSLLIVLSVLIIAMAGAYYYFFSNLRAMGETISTLSNETDTLLSQEGNLDSLRAVFSDTTNDRQKINSYFVQRDGAIDFITTIENLAAFAHLSHETQSVETKEENPPSANRELLHLTFHTTGSWQNTFYFLSLLESLPFNINISHIDLHSTGNVALESSSVPASQDASSSASSTRTVVQKASVWEAAYDFTVKKLK